MLIVQGPVQARGAEAPRSSIWREAQCAKPGSVPQSPLPTRVTLIVARSIGTLCLTWDNFTEFTEQ